MIDKIIQKDGQEYLETEDGLLGLGLIKPDELTLDYPTLATSIPLLSKEQAINIVESSDFYFGESMFDETWTTFQNGYGSCAAYAGASAQSKTKYIQGHGKVDLSGDYLYSLVNGGRDRGSLLKDVMKALEEKGCANRETVKLGEIYRSSYNTEVADAEAYYNRGHEYFVAPDEQSVITSLCFKVPVVIAIHVTNSWRRFDSNGMLAPAPGVGNHSEHLDDIRYNRVTGEFEFRKGSSHGVNYGDKGYCWTNWKDHYRTTSKHHVFYSTLSAVYDPRFDLPPLPEEKNTSSVSIKIHSRSNCGHCVRWEREVMPLCKRVGWVVSKINSSGSVPRFDITKNGATESVIGFHSFEKLQSIINTL